jgi:hypothetical protein
MKRSTLILLAVFVVLLLAVLIAENPFKGEEEREVVPLLAGFDSSAVAVVEVHTETDTTRLKKVDGIWQVATQGDYPADAEAVGEMLSTVNGLEKTEIASRNPEKQSIYQVDGSLIETWFLGPDEKEIAHLYVGKNSPDFSSAYVRLADSDEVVLARGYLRGLFDKGSRGWRDRTIFEFDEASALRFTTQRGDTVITVGTQDKIRWYILTEPDSAEAKMSVVSNQVLRTASTLKADDFDPEVSLADAGLDEPWGTFTVDLEDGTSLTLLVGGEDGGRRWVKRPDRDMVFKIGKYRVGQLFKSVEELRAPVPEETGEQLMVPE